ncbi:MAG: hypothetical protein KDB00_20535 [Planctomycetales bacterium]|nr:hypothetical protein [Planctomycetales bacterium]
MCGNAACKHAHVRAEAQAESERQAELWERVIKLDETLCGAASDPTQTDPLHPIQFRGPHVLGVLPSNDRKLTVLPTRRKTVFVDRLMRIIGEAAAVRFGNVELADDGVGYEESDNASDEHLAILGNGCALCRGHCCPQGSGHAFIHVDTIVKYMESNPGKRPRDVLQDYLSRIGSRTYEDSCVYHCEKGCSLPREMRSKVCNGYLCKGLSEVLYKLGEGSADQALVIAVSDYYPEKKTDPKRGTTDRSGRQQGFVRAGLIDPSGLELYQLTGPDPKVPSVKNCSADDANVSAGSAIRLSADHNDSSPIDSFPET